MDVEKLIQAAKHTNKDKTGKTHAQIMEAYHILAVRDHYESLLNAERSKVIAEVREWANDAKRLDDYWTRNDVIDYDGLTDKLDSMEPDKEEPNVPAD